MPGPVDITSGMGKKLIKPPPDRRPMEKLSIAGRGSDIVTFLSDVATGTSPPFKGQHLSHAHSDKPNQMHGTHVEKNNRFLLLGMIVQVRTLGFHSAILPVSVMFPVLSRDMI